MYPESEDGHAVNWSLWTLTIDTNIASEVLISAQYDIICKKESKITSRALESGMQLSGITSLPTVGRRVS